MQGGGGRTIISDYIRFLKMIYHEGMYGRKRVLSEKTIREMQADQVKKAAVLSGEYIEKALHSNHTGIYGLGEWREKVEEDGDAYQISSLEWAGAYPWINKRDWIYAFFLTHVEESASRDDGFFPFYNAPVISEMTSDTLNKH